MKKQERAMRNLIRKLIHKVIDLRIAFVRLSSKRATALATSKNTLLNGGEEMLQLSLIDYLAARCHCAYISDLRHLDCFAKNRLAREVERTPANTCTLKEWNDALEYIAYLPSSDTVSDAKEVLLTSLRSSPLGQICSSR